MLYAVQCYIKPLSYDICDLKPKMFAKKMLLECVSSFSPKLSFLGFEPLCHNLVSNHLKDYIPRTIAQVLAPR